MKAVQIIAPGKVELFEIEKPTLKQGHALLKVGFVGFCGSDLNTFRGLNPLVKLPIIPGHEIGAKIEDVANDAPPSIKIGMHTTVVPYTNCGHCPACLNGRSNACEWNETLGIQRNGAMSEYILVPYEKIISEDFLPICNFALTEPLSVGFHATSRANVTDIDVVLVIGCGMIGIGSIVSAVIRRAKVIAVDIDDKKLQLAKHLGAEYVINTQKVNLHDRVCDITNKRGADVVIEAVGREDTYLSAISEVAFTGRVVYIGYVKEKILFDTQYFVKKELQIMGSRNATHQDMKAVTKYLKKGIFPVNEMITAVYPPEKAQPALERWANNPEKVFRILIQF